MKINIKDWKKRILKAIKPNESMSIEPKTKLVTGGSERKYFPNQTRDRAKLEQYRNIYVQGGLVAEAIDSYALYSLSQGYRLEGEEAQVRKVEEWLKETNLFDILWCGIIESLVYGGAFQELVRGRNGDVVQIVPRAAYSFNINYDDFGVIQGYTQTTMIGGREQKIELQPDQILLLQILKTGDNIYGISLIQRAYDDIIRDVKVAEASTIAIRRHGSPKFHIQVGREGEVIPQEVLKDVSGEFKEIEAKTDFTTCRDVDIKNIDTSGIANINLYNDFSIMRLCAALGVPEEILGLRRGSTDATANARIQAFYRKISAIQQQVAHTYNAQLFDKIAPGVRLVFNDVSPEDENQKSEWISRIMSTTPIDPFVVLPRNWIKRQFGISEDEE